MNIDYFILESSDLASVETGLTVETLRIWPNENYVINFDLRAHKYGKVCMAHGRLNAKVTTVADSSLFSISMQSFVYGIYGTIYDLTTGKAIPVTGFNSDDGVSITFKGALEIGHLYDISVSFIIK